MHSTGQHFSILAVHSLNEIPMYIEGHNLVVLFLL
jgi:hypothetical protein